MRARLMECLERFGHGGLWMVLQVGLVVVGCDRASGNMFRFCIVACWGGSPRPRIIGHGVACSCVAVSLDHDAIPR